MRSTRRHLMAATTAALLTLTAAACGGDDGGDGGSSGAAASDLADMFVELGAPQDEADCVAERLDGEVTDDQIRQFVDSIDGTDVDEDLMILIGSAIAECSADG